MRSILNAKYNISINVTTVPPTLSNQSLNKQDERKISASDIIISLMHSFHGHQQYQLPNYPQSLMIHVVRIVQPTKQNEKFPARLHHSQSSKELFYQNNQCLPTHFTGLQFLKPFERIYKLYLGAKYESTSSIRHQPPFSRNYQKNRQNNVCKHFIVNANSFQRI